MKNTDVYITGIGLVTALGVGKEENWENMCAGRSGVRMIKDFDTSDYSVHFAAQVHESFQEHMEKTFTGTQRRRMAAFSQLMLLSAHLAMEDSGLTGDWDDPTRVGICIGTGGGGMHYVESQIMEKGDGHLLRGIKRLENLAVLKYMPNAPCAILSIHYGIEGPTYTVSTSCASGATAIASAVDLIRSGRVDVVITGGMDINVFRMSLKGFSNLHALSERNDAPERASRPFDRERDGFVLGDGAGMMILESEDHSRKRGADRYVRVCGSSMTNDGHHLLRPYPEGHKMADTMSRALAEARFAPEEVDYISAHGTSTKVNDSLETGAIKQVFGDHAYRLAVSSQKSMIGHTIGASGAIEAAVTALTLSRDVLTPTINYEFPDEECDLDYVPNEAREKKTRVAVSTSFGFGGHNCCLVLAKPSYREGE